MVKYWYRLRREAKAHPLKAVVLAGMCVAALYYWVPIVKRWTAGRPPQNVALQPAVRRAVAGPAASTPEDTTTLEWKALVAEERHPAWKPVSVSTSRNPFRPLDAGPADAVAREPESDPLPNVAVDPREAGLTLQATAVSTHRRTATIDGRAYSIGDVVIAPDSAPEDATAYRLVEIATDHVVLEVDDRLFHLELEVRYPNATEARRSPTGGAD